MGVVNDEGFKKSNKIGKVGEADYIKILDKSKSGGKIVSYLNLSDNKLAQLVDVDYVVFTRLNGDKEFTEEDAENFILMKGKHPEYCKFIEVKTDRRILETGNIFLEIIMHDKRGCFAETLADKWIYYGLGSDGKIAKMWSIDIEDLRHAISNDLITITKHTASNNGSYSFIVKIDELIKVGAAKEMKI